MLLKALSILFLFLIVVSTKRVVADSANLSCSTPECNQLASLLRSSLNTSANPCNDFYEFSCGGWEVNNPIPEWESFTDISEQLSEQLSIQMKQLLERQSNGSKSSAAEQQQSTAVSVAVNVFEKCVSFEQIIDKDGFGQLNAAVRKVLGNRSWSLPGRQSQSNESSQTFSWTDAWARIIAHRLDAPMFFITTAFDLKNWTISMLHLDSADSIIDENDLTNLTSNAKLITAYKGYIRGVAKMFCEFENDCLAHNGTEGNNTQHCKCPVNTELESEIDQIIQLESALAKLKRPLVERRDRQLIYNKMTVKELSNRTNFDWTTNIFRRVWAHIESTVPFGSQSYVIVKDINYYVKAIELLKRTPARVLENYLGWRVVEAFAKFSTEKFRLLRFQFERIKSGLVKQEDRWRSCLQLTKDKLRWGLSRLFVDHHFSAHEKNEVSTLIDQVQAAFARRLTQLTWLDQQTKTAALAKLNAMHKNIAYPDWLLNNTELDRFVALDDATLRRELAQMDNFMLIFLTTSKRYARKRFHELLEGLCYPDKNKCWLMTPFVVNAFQLETNVMLIPAGILKAPFFSASNPVAINYGGIGALIGHEFTHGFDDQGRKFDAQGNLNQWWSDEMKDRFHNRSKCFVEQYETLVDGVTGLRLNGNNSLGENIADNSGLAIAYDAFTAINSTDTSQGLADLTEYSPAQLFFIAYANTWCTNARPESLKSTILYDVHAPGRYRVNFPAMNLAAFADAFQCPAGSNMNPVKRCTVW